MSALLQVFQSQPQWILYRWNGQRFRHSTCRMTLYFETTRFLWQYDWSLGLVPVSIQHWYPGGVSWNDFSVHEGDFSDAVADVCDAGWDIFSQVFVYNKPSTYLWGSHIHGQPNNSLFLDRFFCRGSEDKTSRDAKCYNPSGALDRPSW